MGSKMMHGNKARALLVATACVALAACSSKAQRIESGLRKGAQYVASSEWDKASVEARNVLQMDNKNAGAFLIAAEVEDGKGSFRNAFANYTKVVELNPASIDGRLGLARIYLLSGDLEKPSMLIDAVLASEPQNTRAQTLKVALTARQGKRVEAIAGADRIVESGLALTPDSSMTLAGLYFNDRAFDKALALLDRAIAAAPQDVRLAQMAAETAQAAPAGSPAAARAAGYYAQATVVAPQNDALWREWATMLVRQRDLAQAETVMRQAVKLAPDSSARRLALLAFTATFRDKQQAEKDYKAAIDAHPRDTDIRFAYSDFLHAQKRPEDAAKALQDIVDAGKDTPAGVIARGQLAALAVDGGKAEDARKILADLLKTNPRDATGLLLRGRLELADGDARAAISDLRSVAKDKPGSTEIAGLLARAHRLAGEPQLAREALADVVKFSPEDAKAHLLLAADMAQTREYAAALPEVDAAIKAAPGNVGAHQMKVEVALSAGDYATAEEAARAAETQFPANPIGHLLHGRVLAVQKKATPALAQFDEAAKLAPTDPQPIVAAVGLLTAQRQFATALQRVDALQAAHPTSALARQMRGEIALAMGDLPRAAEMFEQLVKVPGAPVQAYKNLAAVMVARNDLAGALALLQRGEQANPDDQTLPAVRAEYLGRAGRVDDAIALYEQMLQRAPGNEVAANNLAYVLAQSRRDKPSLERALALATRFQGSSDPGYIDTLGLVQYRLGRYDQAASLLERARALAPNDAGVQLHYGMALYKKGDVETGTGLLRKALVTKPPLPDHDEAQALLART